MSFSATPKAYRRVFVTFLERVQDDVKAKTGVEFTISADVVETIQFAARTPPHDWSKQDILQHLPVLFAMSQRNTFSDSVFRAGLDDGNYRFRQTTFDVTTFVVEKATEILDNWRDAATMQNGAVEISSAFGPTAIVSYGCMRIILGDIESMVKTSFSQGGYRCTDTDPELYRLD